MTVEWKKYYGHGGQSAGRWGGDPVPHLVIKAGDIPCTPL